MVDVDIGQNDIVIRPRGLHSLWSFKRELHIPPGRLRQVKRGVLPEARVRLGRSVRFPGTGIPMLIIAGSFRSRDGWAFWDVVGRGENAVTLTLKGHRYAELVVDVADPPGVVERLRREIG